MKLRTFYFVAFVGHAAVTLVLNSMAIAWAMTVLDSGGSKAPWGLEALNAVAWVFALPVLLPAAIVLPRLGYSDPVNSPIYLILLLGNSALVAYVILKVITWRRGWWSFGVEK